MSEEIKISERSILIKGFSDHIDLDVKGYQNYMHVLIELQQAIEIVKSTITQRSNIVIPSMGLKNIKMQ